VVVNVEERYVDCIELRVSGVDLAHLGDFPPGVPREIYMHVNPVFIILVSDNVAFY